MGGRGTAPLILNLCTTWIWVVTFVPHPLCPREKNPGTKWRETGWVSHLVQTFRRREKSLAPARIWTWIVQTVAYLLSGLCCWIPSVHLHLLFYTYNRLRAISTCNKFVSAQPLQFVYHAICTDFNGLSVTGSQQLSDIQLLWNLNIHSCKY